MTRLVAGVDVGGTKVAAIVVDDAGSVLGRGTRATHADGGPAPLAPVVGAVRDALAAASGAPLGADGAQPDLHLAAIGVGVPGRVDSDTGVVRLATNLGWQGMALADLLTDEFGIPCRVENDARIAAAGLLDSAAAGGARNLAYVAVGTGIGAGIVLDGQLHRGARGMAGEIGHVIVEADGPACSCGQRGCLEAVAAGPAVARRATEAIAGGAQTSLSAVPDLTAREVYDAARDGDAVALGIVDEAGRVLARAIAGLVATSDIERVLIGGGVAGAGQVFARPLQAELDLLRSASGLIAELLPADAVQLLPADSNAVAWGGVALARTALETRADRARPDIEVEEVVARATTS